MTKLYFPTSVDTGVAILRRHAFLDEGLRTPQDTIIGYTDRAVAVLESRKGCCDQHEVALIAVELNEQLFSELLNGDYVHFGPVAHWLAHNTLEIEHGGYGRFAHEAHFSMEIINP